MAMIRKVNRRNFHSESKLFFSVTRRWQNPVIFVDTEFPGTIHRSPKPYGLLSPEDKYELLRSNADELRLIQVGLTLCYTNAKHESLTDLSAAAIADRCSFTWQFDISDFDVDSHPYAPDSLALLKTAGVDVELTRAEGVPSAWLARLLLESGLVAGGSSPAMWVAFQGGYDFGLILKSVFQAMVEPLGMTARLPETMDDFLEISRGIFGTSIYDIKCLMEGCGGRLHGGLEKVAELLRVKRAAGSTHQAGSDSLLSSEVFFKIKEAFCCSFDDDQLDRDDGERRRPLLFELREGLLFGLEDCKF